MFAMEDAGFILASYGITIGAMALYVVRFLRRARRIVNQVPEEDRPWT